jgi:hypothetical protein
MSQRKTVTTQQEFNGLVLLGKRIFDTDFTFNMGIGAMDGFPEHRTIVFFNCTFQDISIQFLQQNRISFTQCAIRQLVFCDGGRSHTFELTDSTAQSIQFRDGGFVNNFRVAGSTTQSISFTAASAANVLAISKSSKINLLNISGCQDVLESISMTESKIADIFIEYSNISNQFLVKGDQSINSIRVYSSDFTDFLIEAPVIEFLIEGDGFRRYSIQRLRLIKAGQNSNGSITFTKVDFTTLDLTGFIYAPQYIMNDVSLGNLITKGARLSNTLVNNISILKSLNL